MYYSLLVQLVLVALSYAQDGTDDGTNPTSTDTVLGKLEDISDMVTTCFFIGLITYFLVLGITAMILSALFHRSTNGQKIKQKASSSDDAQINPETYDIEALPKEKSTNDSRAA